MRTFKEIEKDMKKLAMEFNEKVLEEDKSAGLYFMIVNETGETDEDGDSEMNLSSALVGNGKVLAGGASQDESFEKLSELTEKLTTTDIIKKIMGGMNHE